MIKTHTPILALILAAATLTQHVHAQRLTGTPITTPTTTIEDTQSKPAADKSPLVITANDTLEWFRAEQKVIARGKAKAAQETSSIEAETLSADYREGNEGRFEISQMNADENVIIRTQSSTAYGDHAIYEIDQGKAVMTGENLKMISTDQTVTARDRFEYHVTEGKLMAIGDAFVTRPNPKGGKDTLKAATVSAVFEENAKGERVLKTLEANQNVVITTPTEKITGRYAIYRASTNKAEIKGDVVITRGPNTLKGERAEVDLTTQKSRIFGNENVANGRVKAVFYPGSDE